MDAPTLRYSPQNAPFGALACAALRGLSLGAAPDAALARDAPATLTLADGTVVSGAAALVRFAATAGAGDPLLPSDAADAASCEHWVAFSSKLVSGTTFEPVLSELVAHLAGGARRFLVTDAGPCAGDLAVWGALCAARQWDAFKRNAKFADVAAWHAAVGTAKPAALDALRAHQPAGAAAKAAKEQGGGGGDGGGGGSEAKKGAESQGSFDIGLKDAEKGKVVTRFPPEPSGFLHIGHAKAALLNEYFARTYGGKLILRFDDTNPSKEKEDYVTAILADVAALGIVPDEITYTSDHFEALEKKGGEMIAAGICYVDTTTVDEMRKQRMDGISSACRDAGVDASLALWREMLTPGSVVGASACVRFKIDMSDPNKTMRDPVAYRVNTAVAHHRTGARFCVYPTYDCACPYVDAIEGVTHALRTSEYKDREAQYIWIQHAMGLRTVHMWDYSRLNFEYTTLSKRKLGALVASGKVDGWDDPRFPTVAGVRRRGLTVAALREFILSQGASKNLNTMTWEKLWTLNKRVIDPTCARHTAVEAGPAAAASASTDCSADGAAGSVAPPPSPTPGRVLLTLSGCGAASSRLVPRHKKYAAAGDKPQWRAPQVWIDAADAAGVAAGEEVTLMDWGNAVVETLQTGADGKTVVSATGRLHLDGDVKATKLKLTWLAHVPGEAGAALTPLVLKEYDHLITKKKVEDTDDVANLFNVNSFKQRAALGDVAMGVLPKGETIQLERKGYWIVDVPAGPRGNDGVCSSPAVLIGIPDGRSSK